MKLWTEKNGNWVLDKEISQESALTTQGAILDQVVNLSDNNQKVFEQRKAEIKDAKLEELNTYDDYDQEMIAYQKQEEKEFLALREHMDLLHHNLTEHPKQ